MRVIAFIVEPAVIERILTHVGEPTEPPAVLPARAPDETWNWPTEIQDADRESEISYRLKQ